MHALRITCIREIFFKVDRKGNTSFDWVSFQLVDCPNCPFLSQAVKEVLIEMGVDCEETRNT